MGKMKKIAKKLSLDTETGWVLDILHQHSPNYNQRPKDHCIDLLVIHCISLPEGHFNNDAVTDLFLNRLNIDQDPSFLVLKDLKVSAHFLIKRTGEIIQFVSIYDRAWHAGVSSFDNKPNCNDYSIGIELEGSDHSAYEDKQYLALGELTNLLMKHTQITPNRITGHSQIAPMRKTDPGEYFNWDYFFTLLSD